MSSTNIQIIKNGVQVQGFESGGIVLDVQGTQGQLFSITDSLTGDIFKVSDISGIPIFNINSSGSITIDGDLILDSSTATATSGDYLIISDLSNSSRLTKGPLIGTDSSTYLRNDGTWATPAGTYSHPTQTAIDVNATDNGVNVIDRVVVNTLGHVTSVATRDLSAATTSAAGVMSAADKTKLDGIATNANNYTLPVASATLGGVKSGTAITVDGSGNVSVNNNSHSHTSSNISDATNANTANMIVKRDGSGNFSASEATLTGLRLTGSNTPLITAGEYDSIHFESNTDGAAGSFVFKGGTNGATYATITAGGITATTFTGSLSGTATTASTANALNASNSYSGVSFTASGGIYAAGSSGFYSSTYVTSARNPIWRFANADTYGLSYFQGTAGLVSNLDTIGIHFGTATAAGSPFTFNQADSSFRATLIYENGTSLASKYSPLAGSSSLTTTGAVTGTSFNSITGLSSTNPLMNDTVAVVGTSTLVSRQDHVHPSDTTKANTGGGNATGTWPIGITGNATTATTATQVSNTLTRGTYLTGNNFNGSAGTTWTVDADTAATASKIVARDTNADIAVRRITVSGAAGIKALRYDDNNAFSPYSHSGNTWLRNSSDVWTFQSGTAGDDWTRVFQLNIPNPDAGAGADNLIAELGQRQSNTTSGSYKGIRIVHYTSGAVQDGYLKAGTVDISGNLTVSGNLVVSGTTTTVHSTTVTIDDPILTLGGDTAPTVDDNKDRGVEFRWHNGTTAKTGFFGFDDSTGYFTFIPDAANSSEVFSGTQGTIEAAGFKTTSGTSSGFLKANGTVDTTTYTTNTGTVTSIATTAPISGGTITGSGTISLAANYGDTQNPYASKTANYFLAAPNGSAGDPTFRAIVAADIPTLNQNTNGSAGSVVNAVTFDSGGAGAASGTTFNGSAAQTISYNTLGAASIGHTHSYLPLAGGTLYGTLNLEDPAGSIASFTSSNISLKQPLNLSEPVLIGSLQAIFPTTPPYAAAYTLAGYMFNNKVSSGCILESTPAGDMLTYGINVPQVGNRNPTYSGGLFRIDTRPTAQNFSVIGYLAGSMSYAERFIVNLQNGRVGVGVTPSYHFQVGTDSAAKPSTSTWTVSSDERLKENIVLADLDRCYEIVKTVPLKRYTWKDSVYTVEDVQDRSKLGWIANDVQQVFPKAVNTHDQILTSTHIEKDENGNDIEVKDILTDCLDLNADQIYAAMYGTIQKLQQKVEELEARLAQANL